MQLTLSPGWNFFSLPVIPEDGRINEIFSELNFDSDYDQVSRYNPEKQDFDNYNNTSYNQFDTLEYGRGYLVYITNTSDVTLTITGNYELRTHNYELKQGWNLIGTPAIDEITVSGALNNLQQGIDYDRIVRYNESTQLFENISANGQLKPGKAYYLHCLQDVAWHLPFAKESTTFVYDGDGGRVKKNWGLSPQGTVPDFSTVYIGSLYEVDSDGTTRNHIFLGANRIATASSQGSAATEAISYYHSDHLGSSNVITDQSGQLVQHLEYLPYGQTSVNIGTDVAGYKFTGKELDDSTGLYFYGARYYDPEIGRFITADPTVQLPTDPQTLNRYSYCRNNPIKYIDPLGYGFWSSIGKFFKKFAGTIASVAFTFVGMPFVGALVGSAISTALNGGNFQNFAIGLGVGIVAGYAGGTIAGGFARSAGMNLAGIETAFLRGGLSGALGGMGIAGAYGGDVGEGAWKGAAAGAAAGGLLWGLNTARTNSFLKNNAKLSNKYTAQQRTAVLQSIREAGQSPVGGRLMSGYIRSGSVLNLSPEGASPAGSGWGPHVIRGTNDMYFDGDMQGRYGSFLARESWGPTMDDASTFIHELGHTASGFAIANEPLNVAGSENLYRGWTGAAARNDYGVLSQGQASIPVPNRSIWEGLIYTW